MQVNYYVLLITYERESPHSGKIVDRSRSSINALDLKDAKQIASRLADGWDDTMQRDATVMVSFHSYGVGRINVPLSDFGEFVENVTRAATLHQRDIMDSRD